ncbi:SDR family oxidoreductase [Microbulbifer hydrolyticus]|uniref:NAD(P)-dependent dehydrogenase (Short-subunit alcohol dehydrogenase family) n=1 Tax=Microbulbifer hydrolyticus TaxID=48074 RepID=A0A6P1TFM3_9GAMM|nr:SDR family oxidoreductase [Microbulbifer hydrolyticus]MBB5209878.1 NAD(P)-dependent dehydrogenase (short-subunit alcohol dehydrogenase family) [Microbulbifer hydrolyticus]QHQ39582.1 SDR family NAD(P)-dependent oxidoreductase [Microbulbifer hydrolyticus]
MPGTILITGCNRGIGLEMTRQFAEDGWHVIATCRNPSAAWELGELAAANQNIEIHSLDVTDYEQMAELASDLKGRPLDILLSNAGYYGPKGVALGNVDVEEWRKVLEANTIAPYKLVETFYPQLAAGARKVVGILSSKVGSIDDNDSGGGYIYRSSKTAVNQVVKSLSIDLADQGIKVLALHPGWVQTDMGGPNALISAEESVAGLKQLLLKASAENSGHFYNYDGSSIPW